MFDYPVYLLYRAGTDLLTLLPLPFLFAMGQICGAIAWVFLPQYRKLALRNVRIAFGDELSATEMRRIVRRHFQQLGANLLCSVKFTRMPMEKILERVRLENFEHAENCFRQKQPFVLCLSHIGSWEFCTRLFPHFAHADRDCLPTHPQSLHRSARPGGAQPIWSTSLGAQRRFRQSD